MDQSPRVGKKTAKLLESVVRGVRERLRGRGVAAYAVEQQAVETVGELVGIALRRQPRIGPVQGREDEQRGRRVVEVGSELAELSPLAEEGAEALLVAAALRHDLVATLAVEVPPLADEDRRHVELVGDDAEMRA